MADGSLSRDDRFVQRLNFSSGNLSVEWKEFKAQFEIFKVAKKYNKMEEGEKIANLLVLMGLESVPIYNQFEFSDTDEQRKKKLRNVIAMFDRHFEPVKNVIYERVKFNGMRQGTSSIHQFITDLRCQADNCDYGAVRDDLIRDRIVIGVNDPKLREYLIDVEDLTLQRCIQKAKQYVSHHEQAARMDSGHDDALDMLRRPGGKSESRQGSVEPTGGKKCFFCGRAYPHRSRCPAKSSTCHDCGLKGHWAGTKSCKGKRPAGSGKMASSAEEVIVQDMDGLFLGSDCE